MPTAGAEFQLTSLSIDVGGYEISQITGSRSRGVYHALENFRGRKKKKQASFIVSKQFGLSPRRKTCDKQEELGEVILHT